MLADSGTYLSPIATLTNGQSKSCVYDLNGFSVALHSKSAPLRNYFGLPYVTPTKEETIEVEVNCYGKTKSFSILVTNPNTSLSGKQFAFVTDPVSPNFVSLEAADSICENLVSSSYGFKNKSWKAILLEPGKTLDSRGIKLLGDALYDVKGQLIFGGHGTTWSNITTIAPSKPILTLAGQSYHGYVWTGLERNSSASQNACNKWSQLYSEENDSPRGAVGIADDLGTPGGWANAGTLTCTPNAAAIYCISQ